VVEGFFEKWRMGKKIKNLRPDDQNLVLPNSHPTRPLYVVGVGEMEVQVEEAKRSSEEGI